jgi:hypothetical protein
MKNNEPRRQKKVKGPDGHAGKAAPRRGVVVIGQEAVRAAEAEKRRKRRVGAMKSPFAGRRQQLLE